MTTNTNDPSPRNRSFDLVSYFESEEGDCQTLPTTCHDICPAIAWANTVINFEEVYGDEFLFTNLVWNP